MALMLVPLAGRGRAPRRTRLQPFNEDDHIYDCADGDQDYSYATRIGWPLMNLASEDAEQRRSPESHPACSPCPSPQSCNVAGSLKPGYLDPKEMTVVEVQPDQDVF